MARALALAAALGPSLTQAIDFSAAPPSNLEFDQLGQVGVVGDFGGISLYQFEGQTEKPFSTNGSESLLTQLPNAAFGSLIDTDATIQAMCTFIMENGDMAGVVIGGNFTSLNGIESPAVALFNPNTSDITPLSGLEGQISAVLCDQETNTVYVGGNFRGVNSTNALAWFGTDGWTPLPFSGFNGPVTSITKSSNGHIIFGGSFTGLGNSTLPRNRDGQIINLSGADITSGNSNTRAGFSDPKNIICKTDGNDGAGDTWLLQDATPGFWQASFDFGFRPSKIRLHNTRLEGRGTKTWRFTALPLNGILELSYVDPATGENTTCTNQCPLSNDPDVPFMDFHFVRSIGMKSFRIDISEFFGEGGGLNGIQLYEDDIFSYAVDRFNEPACAGIETASSSTRDGPFSEVDARDGESDANYLTARLVGPITEQSASVTFFPDIKESGNYSVNMYTPGCIQDNSCTLRGQVNITGVMSSSGRVSFTTSIFQTNNFEKFDQIYFGFIDATSPSFRPSVTMTPLAGQSLGQMVFVAQRVGFSLLNSTGGLNGLFDYDPSAAEVDVTKFGDSPVNRLGTEFSGGSAVSALATSGDTIYVGGNFTSSNVQNVIAINTQSEDVTELDGGLNGDVTDMYLDGTKLYVSGEFSSTQKNGVQGMSNVGVYDTDSNTWTALGAGVNGKAFHVVPMKINLTANEPETAITFTGEFTECSAFGGNPAVPVNGLAVWMPSRNNWLQNVDQPVPRYSGTLTAAVLDLPGGGSLYAGSLASSSIGANGDASLTGGQLNGFPVKIEAPEQQSSSNLTRRDISSEGGVTGVVTGLIHVNGGTNITVLAGHFSAQTSNGDTANNLLLIDGADDGKIVALGSAIQDNSTFLTVGVLGDTLYAGGKVSGEIDGSQVQGLVAYNLASKSFGQQPPPISGGNATVSAVLTQRGDAPTSVYVAGSFAQAGSLPCTPVCVYNEAQNQWSQPGTGLAGNVECMMWASDTLLLVGGSLTLNSTVNTSLAVFDTQGQFWDAFPGVDALPGPVEVMTPGSADGKKVWVAGHDSDGDVFVMAYDGNSQWRPISQGLQQGTDIRSLQIFSLTEKHDRSDLLDDRESLLITGSIVLSDFGTASAVVFDGNTFQPFALTTNSGNTAGSITKIFSEKDQFFKKGKQRNYRPRFPVSLQLMSRSSC